ncbi:MAG: AraC family transcriptional regulator [Ferrovibrionaceae bacterium]
MRTATRAAYAERIARVQSFISDHLDDDLDLDALAELACLSPFHFHRIYRSMTGETLAGTLRRLRLHRAAGQLIAGRVAIARVATGAGYGSVTAFRRAFQACYRATPATYRASAARATLPAVTIGRQPALVVAAIRHQGPYMEIGRAFERLISWAAGHGLLAARPRSFGIYFDDPQSKPASQLRSAAALLVPGGGALAAGMEWLAIAGGRYAEVEFRGPYAELERAYRGLYGVWLPGSGEEAADGPCVEEYLNDPRNHLPSDWLTAVRLPLMA